ncbi:MAG: GNAT family N-acetyltransferase [Actinomycetota bacterium]
MTAHAVTARVAGDDDRDVVLTLAADARSEARTERGGPMLLDHDLEGRPASSRLDKAFVDEHQRVWVGEIDGVPVGYAVAVCVDGGDVRVARLDELFVHQRARNLGVAAAMLAAVEAWGVAGGCHAVESQVLPGNRAAKNFFERLGMVTRRMVVSRALED